MKHKAGLLQKAKVVDDEMFKGGELVKFLRDAIPDKIRAKTKKSDVVDICLQAWRVLDLVIFHKTSRANKLTQTQQHDLNDYIGMMERAFNHCKALVDDEVNKDYEQTEKMPLGEENHGYCEGGAVKPAKVAHRTCPKCHDPFMHNPAINIEIRKKNAQLKATWVAKNKEFERYERFLKSKNPMAIRPVDDKGRPMMKVLPPPKLEAEYLICTAHTGTHCYA